MVSKTSAAFGFLKNGYTLIEVVVVLGIVAFMGTLTLFGISNQNKDQRVLAAQRELVVNLKAIQTKVDSGVGGVNGKMANFRNGDNFYTLDGVRVDLTPGVTLSLATTPVTVYFWHPALTTLPVCGDATVYFACGGAGPAALDSPVIIGFTGSSRTVRVEGFGMNVNRIYESPN